MGLWAGGLGGWGRGGRRGEVVLPTTGGSGLGCRVSGISKFHKCSNSFESSILFLFPPIFFFFFFEGYTATQFIYIGSCLSFLVQRSPVFRFFLVFGVSGSNESKVRGERVDET